ncbi:MAG: DnaA regulatory inactivator Hda [Burkholderiaceae bacterium]|nr:DnaA regulatory inactivator Hda [Burkholderiaceae bacterium]
MAEPTRDMYQLPLDLHRIEAPSLDNFVVGRNGEVLAQLRLLHAGATQGAPTMIYLWGEAGCGKTHLLQALAGAQRVLGPEAPLEAFAIDGGSPGGLPPGEGPAIVAIDDCERLDEARQQRAFQLINHARARSGTTVVAAGAQPPLALALRDDLRTRLGSGLVYRLQLLSDEEKAAVLERVAAERGVAVSSEVVPWLIAHTSRDIRALLRLFDALDRHAFERKRAITLPLLRELEAAGALIKSG